jgi:septal ring factor EnvC (AmiA/AmiB activator)
MTANELADLLIIVDALQGNVVLKESATMLRQQAEEIEKLQRRVYTQTEIIRLYEDMLGDADFEIKTLKEKLELAEWDEDAWKKFKQDNYEVINLGDIKDDCK